MQSQRLVGDNALTSNTPSILSASLGAQSPLSAPTSVALVASNIGARELSAPAVAHADIPAGATLHVGAGEDFSTIQAAVAAAHDGDTIVVDSGVYHEQVTVNGLSNLTIEAAQGAAVIIEAPDTTTENGDGVTAVVAVENGTNDVLRNIIVNGNGQGDTAAGNFVGVLYQDASGGTDGVTVFGTRGGGSGGTITGAQGTGYGVYVNNDAGGDRLDFTMTGGTISDFQKGGIYAIHANVDISGVSISGAGSTSVTAQNGAVFSDDTGSFHDNMISKLGFTLDTATAAGVLTIDASNFTVTGNVIAGSFANEDELRNFVGVYASNDAGGSSIISDNTISNVNEGVVADGPFSGLSITGNDVTNITEYEPDQPGFGIDVAPDPSITANYMVEGSAGNDTIAGAMGDDTLSGGSAGDDTLAGAQGNDTYVIDTNTVTVIENGDEGHDTVIASVSYELGANLEDLTLTGTGPVDGAGNFDDNLITGNDAANRLAGSQGDDTVVGGGGKDQLFGGQDNDTLVSQGDGDVMNGGKGTDTFQFTDLQNANAGHIVGFEAGETLDLSAVGPLTQVDAFDGAAGEFTVTYKAHNDRTVVNIDTDGDGQSDHKIIINGDFSHTGDIHFVL